MKLSPTYFSQISVSNISPFIKLHRKTISMETIKISQVLKLLLILAALFIITPLLSTSLRTTYLYFIVHLLIISLGAEAGVISFFSKSPYDKKLPSTNSIVTQKQHNITPVIAFPPSLGTSEPQETVPKVQYDHIASLESSLLITNKENTGKVVEKCASEKIIGAAEVYEQVALVKKCPSMPSLFFIGVTGEEINVVEEILKEEKYTKREEVGDQLISKQELFNKAETFIGNFYKQLKIQREDSRKRLHDFYQKEAF